MINLDKTIPLDYAILYWEVGCTISYLTIDNTWCEVDSYEDFDELGESVVYKLM